MDSQDLRKSSNGTTEGQQSRGTQRGGNACNLSDQVGVFFYHELHFGPVNGVIFNLFMASLEAMVGDYQFVFIMDNIPIQKSMPETYHTMQFKHLPPYSPFLNPMKTLHVLGSQKLREATFARSRPNAFLSHTVGTEGSQGTDTHRSSSSCSALHH